MAKEIKHKIDNLFIAHIGIKSSGTTYSKETIICKRKKESYTDHYFFTDIFTNNTYRLCNDFHTNVGDTVAFNPVSLISVFKIAISLDFSSFTYTSKIPSSKIRSI